MRDADKPFVMYRRSRYNFNIVPRGGRGWTQLGIWMALFMLPTAVFVIYAEALEGRPAFWIALVAYLAVTLIWSIAAIRWMKARAEVVDVTALLAAKRQAERRGRGGRAR